MNQIAPIPSQNDLENENIYLKNKVLEQEKLISQLTDYLRLAKQARFGRSSEKGTDDTTPLFPGMGQVFDEAAPEKEPKKEAPQKRKASGGRKPLPKDLPREEVIHDLKEEEKVCDCGHKLHRIGQEESEQLEIIPAQVKVLRNVRFKYACKGCEDTLLVAPMPPQAIPKSMAGPGLLSHIIVAKYDDHLPLYRQAEMWERSGVDLDRTTIGRWVIQAGTLLEPLVELMRQDIVASDSLQADETRVQVLSEKGRKNISQSQMWVFKTVGDKEAKILYHYNPSRSSDVISSILEGFSGYLQSDGYGGYAAFAAKSLSLIKLLGCWGHARRKFVDITKISPKKGIAFEVTQRIAELYKIEKEAKAEHLTFDEIRDRRQRCSKPLLEELKSFLDEHQDAVPPKGLLGRAIGYIQKNWDKLIVYLERGDLEIDNNATERAIKPFAVGRKNWLFQGSVKGAEASAVLYSLIETAKSYGHNPYDYLKDIFIRMPIKISRDENLKDLLPYTWKPQAI